MLHVAYVCVWSPLSRPNPSVSTWVRSEAFETPSQHEGLLGRYFWMAGLFDNGTITAFCCSDSARVDGMGRLWTNGREKKTQCRDSAQPCHCSHACSLVSESVSQSSVRALDLVGIVAPKRSRITPYKSRYASKHLPVLDCARQSREIEKRKSMCAWLL